MACVCELSTKMAASSNLKISRPSSVSDEIVVFRRKTGKFTFRKQSEKSSSGTKLAQKRLFEERKEDVEVGSFASRKARPLRFVLEKV